MYDSLVLIVVHKLFVLAFSRCVGETGRRTNLNKPNREATAQKDMLEFVSKAISSMSFFVKLS